MATTPIHLHNTLTRKVEELKPIKPGEVSLYTCGPTVYNYYHIGNLRNAVFNDTLRRTLEASGYKVNHVMNITDVGHLVSDDDEGEDKLEKGAAREGKTVWDVAEHYTEAFKRDMAALNILPPSINPHREKNKDDRDSYARATDFIPEQIEMVKLLLEKNFAYQTKQAIYFDVTKLEDYGKLTGQKLADKEVAARADVVSDPDKKHPYDFAVWFFTVSRFEGHAMHWASPWGEGFPGWHLECSAIIHATLGDPIDIHTGGVDHIGTHHPNEMAQTEAAFGHELANFWAHNEFILVDGAKMAKSKGNAYTLADITKGGFSPLAFRLLALRTHYRSELNYTTDDFIQAQVDLDEMKRTLNTPEIRIPRDRAWDLQNIEGMPAQMAHHIRESLSDDLGTSLAFMRLSNLIKYMRTVGVRPEDLDELDQAVSRIDDMLGLGFKLTSERELTKEQLSTIGKRETIRNQAKEEQDLEKKQILFKEAGLLRDQMKEEGIEVIDGSHGPRWRRIEL